MALVGQAATSYNIFVDVPLFLRGLSQSLNDEPFGPLIRLSDEMKVDLYDDDPTDPTRVVDTYEHDWWNFDQRHSKAFNPDDAFRWHVNNVSNRSVIFDPDADTFPDW